MKQRHLSACKQYSLGHQWQRFLFLCIFFTGLEKSEKEDGILHVMQSFRNKQKNISPETWWQKDNNSFTFSTLTLNNSYEKKKVLEGEKVSEYLFPLSLCF